MPHYIDFIPRPRQSSKLPDVLDESEIQIILSNCRTLRYKLLFSLIYSSGLRISEALNLHISDIDLVRRVIHIRSSKNRKDRYSVLSEKVISLYSFYLNRYKPDSLLFFSLHDKARKMSKRHCQQIFQNLVAVSQIKKNAHIHTLRHSFATHLLEHNTNIFYIMQLLGHASIRTTIIYLHLQKPETLNIHSPLDLCNISLSDFGNTDHQPTLRIA
jgi:Site-specific recombinase XerD